MTMSIMTETEWNIKMMGCSMELFVPNTSRLLVLMAQNILYRRFVADSANI